MNYVKNVLLSSAVCGAVYYFAFTQGKHRGIALGQEQCVSYSNTAREQSGGQAMGLNRLEADLQTLQRELAQFMSHLDSLDKKLVSGQKTQQ